MERMPAYEGVLDVGAEVSPAAEYTPREELVHTISHGLGFVAAVIGLVALLAASSERGTALDIVGVGIFGITLTFLYASSTLYHGLPESASKNIMRKLDHIAIYLLISGTYTPFVLTKMQNSRGWAILILIWVLAVVGIVLELVGNGRKRRTSLALYLAMGWLAVFAVEPLLETLAPAGVTLLVLGGVVYSVGIIFYAWRRLPYGHAVWHGFVLGGSALHFTAVIGFVVP